MVSSFMDSQAQMHAKTTVMASASFTEDRFWLNGKEEPINDRMLNCLHASQCEEDGTCSASC
mgnify:CR=1 FL=1